MFKKIMLFIITQIVALVIGYLIIMSLVLLLGYFIIGNTCTEKELETIMSPNEIYKIITYRVNCGATVDFSVKGKLCTNDNKCKEVYDCYHEKDSYVYWIDNTTVSINNKRLNINKDKYSWKKDKNYQEHLYKKH